MHTHEVGVEIMSHIDFFQNVSGLVVYAILNHFCGIKLEMSIKYHALVLC